MKRLAASTSEALLRLQGYIYLRDFEGGKPTQTIKAGVQNHRKGGCLLVNLESRNPNYLKLSFFDLCEKWLLVAAGVEFEEQLFETKKQLEKLKATVLLFQQVPMVEIDGMKLVQFRAILHYIAEKYNLLGKDIKERAMIIMYSEGTMDLMELIMLYPFLKGEEQPKRLTEITNKAKYFPVYEKVLKTHRQNFLVGNQMSMADEQLIEAILTVEETVPDALSGFSFLQEFKT
ncbi:glutathione S-transferase-like [Petaurus breviceps papuanus]|uniref:glutathione S-transferase-like n=1 Tax=Petaurus breviceps papuanus TaxID=3040969 RepID=UPI0036DE21D0